MSNSKYIEKAKAYREGMACPNCAQTVLMAFAEEAGLTETQASQIAANFGGGMRTGSVCGVVTGAIMALGALGVDNPRVAAELQAKMKENHGGTLNCAELLKKSMAEGLPKKQHCDGLIMEAVSFVEEYLNNK